MNILSEFENKKKVYLVMNEFERYVDNYDKSIGDESKKYFDLKDKPDILSRGFYKLWELMFMFDIVDITKENFRIQLRKIKKILSTMQIMMNSSVNFKLSPDFCQGVKPTTWTQCTRRKYKDTNYCGILSHMVHDPTIPPQHIDYSDEEFDFDLI